LFLDLFLRWDVAALKEAAVKQDFGKKGQIRYYRRRPTSGTLSLKIW
jgi:hypothetical protein